MNLISQFYIEEAFDLMLNSEEEIQKEVFYFLSSQFYRLKKYFLWDIISDEYYNQEIDKVISEFILEVIKF
ncbi:MAG: hypothetical protein IT262_00430 [Saprospiraceae bacterium]|nr:hypothetical protein [Saprospiraceae bacterium]